MLTSARTLWRTSPLAHLAGGAPVQRWTVGVVGGLWGLRLAWHLLTDRVLVKEEDGRYRALRAHWGERADLHFRAGGMWLRQRELSRARDAFARAAALEPRRDAYAEALRRIEADVAAREGGATD